MRKITALVTVLFLAVTAASAQTIFWVENFEGGSSSGMLASSYIGPNGAWMITPTGFEAGRANTFYVSCAENGHTAGVCGSGCAAVSATATLSTLHVGSDASIMGDVGAAYFSGGGCFSSSSSSTFSPCVTTDKRAESPTINCSAQTGITMSYYYIENGDGSVDNGSVWYFNGSTWSLLEDPPKSVICGGSQGTWAKRIIALPASADHNPNVKIGFRWTNDDDGIGTDPSFAIDSVSLSGTSTAPVASFTVNRDTICQDSCITFTNTSTGPVGVDSFHWSIVGVPYSVSGTSSLTLCTTISVVPPNTYTMQLVAFGGGGTDTAKRDFTIIPTPHPVISKSGHVLSLAGTYNSYQWYRNNVIVAGATNSSYTYSLNGTFTVKIDSGGCPGTSIAISTVGVTTEQPAENKLWTMQANPNVILINSEQLIETDMYVTVSDQTGRNILSDLWQRGTNKKQLDASSLSPGLYIIRVSGGNVSAALKWVKQ